MCILLTIIVGALFHQTVQVHTQPKSPVEESSVEHSWNMLEQVRFGYSTKNIGIPGKQEYLLRLTHSVSHFINRLRDVFRKKTVLCGKNSHVGRPPPPPPQYGNFFDKLPFFSEYVPKRKNLK